MRRAGTCAAVAVTLVLACAQSASADDLQGLAGRVLGKTSPLPAASVYAYQIADSSLQKVLTDAEGNFLFDALPAGLYRIIAHKPGFVPGVVMLTRSTSDSYQFLELELAETDRDTGVVPADDFWSLRAQIPGDVLRDIRIADIELGTRTAAVRAPEVRLSTEMQAMTGVDQIAADRDTHVTSGRLGIEGRVGSMKLGLRGRYLQMEPGAAVHEPGAVLASGATSTLSLEMATADDGTRVELTSLSKRMVGGAGEDTATPVDFEHYGVQVSKVLGDGQSDFTAQYTSQSNFHRHGVSDPAQIPEASSTWRLEGTYTLPLSDRSTLQTGIRYRALEPQSLAGLERDGDHYQTQEQMDLFGRGGIRVLPAVVMEYGLYTTLRDGTVSMMPRGGVVLQLSPTWQASTLASHKVEQGNGAELLNDFVPAFFGDAGTCEQNEEYCYHLLLTHRSNDTDSLSFGATQREFSDTRRLYFSDELFDRMESIYLVPGDQVPELQFAVSRQLTPTIVTRLESSVGSGGGGTFYTADQVPFTNHVDYLVTSLDTQFQSTATGLFLAFHRLSQQLDSPATDAFADPRSYEAERLQLVVTQNLNILLDLAADWALQLNMEVSRSHDPGSLDPRNDELRKRLLGGIAIRF